MKARCKECAEVLQFPQNSSKAMSLVARSWGESDVLEDLKGRLLMFLVSCSLDSSTAKMTFAPVQFRASDKQPTPHSGVNHVPNSYLPSPSASSYCDPFLTSSCCVYVYPAFACQVPQRSAFLTPFVALRRADRESPREVERKTSKEHYKWFVRYSWDHLA